MNYSEAAKIITLLNSSKDTLILDTEGLDSDRLYNLCIIDLNGNILYNEYYVPPNTKSLDEVSPGVGNNPNGFTLDHIVSKLGAKPITSETIETVQSILNNKNIIHYSKGHDQDVLKDFNISANWYSLLTLSNAINGQENQLDGGHTAELDCIQTLHLFNTLVLMTKSYKEYQFITNDEELETALAELKSLKALKSLTDSRIKELEQHRDNFFISLGEGDVSSSKFKAKVTSKFSVTGTMLKSGVSLTDVLASNPELVSIKSPTSDAIKQRVANGDYDHLISYELSEKLSVTGIKPI